MRIRFTKGYQVKGTAFVAARQGTKPEDPDDSPSYKEGQEIEVSEESARHFINRGVAVDVSKSGKQVEGKQAESDDYEDKTVAELHKLASEREIEGRSELTTKADLVKALDKDDKAKAKAKPEPKPEAKPQAPQPK